MKTPIFLFLLASFSLVSAQNELFINGDEVHVKSNDVLFVGGDVHISGATGVIAEDAPATIEVTGDWYKDHPTIQQPLDGKVKFSGANPQKITSAGNGNLTGTSTYFTDVEVQNGSGFIYLDGANIEIKNSLNFLNNSRLRTGPTAGVDGTAYTQYVYVSNSSPSAITGLLGPGSPRYIEGRLRQQMVAGNSYQLPVGIDMSSSNNNQVATLVLNQGAGVTESAFTYDPGGPITPIIACGGIIDCTPDHGYWTITPVAGLTLTGTVDYDIILQPGNAASNCSGVQYVVLKDNTFTGANTCAPNVSNTFSSVPRYGFTSFSQFRVGSMNVPMPLELLSFYGEKNGGSNKLFWTTNMEQNSHHFDIERSFDGSSFEKFAEVPASIHTTAPKSYGTIDESPFFPGTYYRLKMVDIDGTFRQSNVIYLTADKELFVSLFPNPFSNDLTVHADNVTSTMIFRLYDAAGKEVFTQRWTPTHGQVHEAIDLSHIAIGSYFYNVITSEDNITGKLLKTK